MASDETLLKICDRCLKNMMVVHEDTQKGVFTNKQLEDLNGHLKGMTDIYTPIQLYRPFNEVVFRILSEQQHNTLKAHWQKHKSQRFAAHARLYIALRLKPDETIDDFADTEDNARAILGLT